MTLDDRARSPYVDVPFEVPGGVGSIEIRLEVESDGDARIDLGCRGPAGWRGWSGTARRRVVIGARAATWGYTPGEPEEGFWHVVLGLHQIPACGADVVVTVTAPGGAVEPDPPSPPPPSRGRRPASRVLPAPTGLSWFAGDFHAHTLHSDGALSIDEVAALAADEGLDFIALTEHNTTSHHRLLPTASARYGVSLIPGQEVTTGRGHANAIGAMPWVDFREHPDAWSAHVREYGGFLSVNHPVSGDCAWQWSLSEPPTHAELLHSTWLADPVSAASWAWWSLSGARHPIGGSDFHRLGAGVVPGRPVTWVAAEDSAPEAIVAAAAAGRTALALAPDAPALVRDDEGVVAVGADGCIYADADGRRKVVHGERVRLAETSSVARLETPERMIVAVLPPRR
jgi:hypothetical protein